MKILRLLILFLIASSCSVKYSLTGASIGPETKTFQVNYFQNNNRKCGFNTIFLL